MSSPEETARGYFSEKFNCAQAVFMAFAELLGMDLETAARTAAAFGGGLARRGETCGAVSGALMVIGLKFSDGTPETKEEVYRLAEDFMHRFEKEHGTLRCRALIGYDLRTEEGRRQAHDSGITSRVCPEVVGDAARIVQSMLQAG